MTTTTTTTIYLQIQMKGIVPQIAAKLVEAGQDEHENIMENTNYNKLQTCWKTEVLTLHNNADLIKLCNKIKVNYM